MNGDLSLRALLPAGLLLAVNRLFGSLLGGVAGGWWYDRRAARA